MITFAKVSLCNLTLYICVPVPNYNFMLVFCKKILCDVKPKPVSRKFWSNHGSLVGGKLPNTNYDQTTKWKITKHTNHK